MFDAFDETIFPGTTLEFSPNVLFGLDQEGVILDRNLIASNFGVSQPLPKVSSASYPAADGRPIDRYHQQETCNPGAGLPLEHSNGGISSVRQATTAGDTRIHAQKRQHEDEENSIGFYDYNLIADEHEVVSNEESVENQQQHADEPKSKPPRKRQRILEEQWEKYRPVIKKLYITEGKSLAEVMDFMAEHFQFNPP